MNVITILNGGRVGLKAIIVLVMVFLLLLPMAKINHLINERMTTQEGVVKEFEKKWGTPQEVSGPVLRVPYHDANSKTKKMQYAYLSPEKVSLNGEVAPQMKKRGIYEMPVYAAEIAVSASFALEDLHAYFEEHQLQANWEEVRLLAKMSDYSRLTQIVRCKVNEVFTLLQVKYQKTKPSGDYLLEAMVNLSGNKQVDVDYTLAFNGINQLTFSPKGSQVAVVLRGNWADPSYIGDRLTSKNEVKEGEFSAAWHYINPPEKREVSASISRPSDAFGVHFLVANDHYLKANRSAKYALLLIGLTYVAFFFIELLQKKKMHPLQYALVGLALCLFYSLLVAFAEHMSFNWAYLASMAMTVALVSWYTKLVFDRGRVTTMMALMQTTVYGFIFLIIQLQVFALLAGSLGLFVILAVLMYCSKKVDFQQNQSIEENA